jgi:hypothetical protein
MHATKRIRIPCADIDLFAKKQEWNYAVSFTHGTDFYEETQKRKLLTGTSQ